MAATCGTGLSFCGDGTCKESCEGIANACQCGDDTIKYYPCAANQLVNISHFDPINQVVQTQNTCASNGNYSSLNIGTWGTFDKAHIWLSCPVVDPYFTWKEPMWLAVWSLMAAEAAILLLWAIYKSLCEVRFHRATSVLLNNSSSLKTVDVNSQIDESECKVDMAIKTSDEKNHHKSAPVASTITTDSLRESEKLHFRGFQTDYFGLLAFCSVVITTLLFFVFLGCLVGDYCKLPWYDEPLFSSANFFLCIVDGTMGPSFGVFLSSDLSSKIFCAVWHISAAWFCGIMFTRKTIRNYFRIESYPHKCPYIQVERKQDELIFLADDNKWISKLREIEKRVTERLR